ncbi:unnamed protein product [Amoebophrya sp. A25]|nr:unnamed protein product [Amoebophrya sp. A25]|eukprot:GSA25T00014716001.1
MRRVVVVAQDRAGPRGRHEAEEQEVQGDDTIKIVTREDHLHLEVEQVVNVKVVPRKQAPTSLTSGVFVLSSSS